MKPTLTGADWVWRQDFGLVRICLRTGDKENSGCPRGEEVEPWEQFCSERRQERPVEAEDLGQCDGDEQVKGGVGRRNASGSEEWEEADLKSVGGKGDGPRDPVLRTAKRAEAFEPASDFHDVLDVKYEAKDQKRVKGKV
jgi:hypothetical protein